MRSIHLFNDSGRELDGAPLIDAVRATLHWHACENGLAPGGSVTIVLTGDRQVRDLNRKHRGIDSVTDVLTFPALPHGLPGEEAVLGELVVAVPWTAWQANCAGHELSQDLVLLMVHGTLHLLGHKHDTGQQRARMWSAQDAVLRSLGLAPELVPQLERMTLPEKADRQEPWPGNV